MKRPDVSHVTPCLFSQPARVYGTHPALLPVTAAPAPRQHIACVSSAMKCRPYGRVLQHRKLSDTKIHSLPGYEAADSRAEESAGERHPREPPQRKHIQKQVLSPAKMPFPVAQQRCRARPEARSQHAQRPVSVEGSSAEKRRAMKTAHVQRTPSRNRRFITD